MFRITIDQSGTFADGALMDDKQRVTLAKAATNHAEPTRSIINCIALLAYEGSRREADKHLIRS